MSDFDKAKLNARVPATFDDLVEPSRTALIMWDFQKGLAVRAHNVEPMVENAKKLLAAADAAGVFVVWSRHTHPPLDLVSGPWLRWMMKRQGVKRPEDLKPTFQRGTEETEYLPGLLPAAHHLIVEKGQASLFYDTPLDSRLKVRGIKTVVIAGFATDIGVEFNARHAFAAGYFSVIAEDATGAHTQQLHDNSITFLRTWVDVETTSTIIDAWSRSAR